jgi:hypothetical protein
MKQLVRVGFGLAGMLAAGHGIAGGCSLIPDLNTGQAQVQIGGSTEGLTAAKHLAECSNIVLKSGAVALLYEVDGEHRVKACATNEPCAADAKSAPSFLAQKGDGPRVGQGLDKDYARLNGLPYGWILEPASVTTFGLARVQEKVQKFALLDQAKHPLFEANVAQPSIAVPADLFKPGARYHWQIVTDRAQHEGSFRMMDDKKKQSIATALSAARESSPNASAFEKRLQELAVYRDYDLGYEVERLRQEMKL